MDGTVRHVDWAGSGGAMDHGGWRRQMGVVDGQDGCGWVSVSSGTGSPVLSRTKPESCKMVECV